MNFIKSLEEGDIKEVEKFLHQSNVNIIDECGNSALHIACKNADENIVKLLLKKKANVNVINNKYDTPLHIACKEGRSDIVRILFTDPIKDIILDVCNKDGNTALHIACNEENLDLITLLLEHKANVNIFDKNNNTALHIACEKQNKEMIITLLKNEADVNIYNEGSYVTPFSSLFFEYHEDDFIINTLLENKANINTECDDIGNTPLHIACSESNSVAILALIRNKADINTKNLIGDTPLFKINSMDVDVIKEFLEHDNFKINEDVSEIYGTLLHTACIFNMKDVVDILLKNDNIEVNVVNKHCDTPLNIACTKGNYDIVEKLIKHGDIDFDITNKIGNNVLHTACDYGRYIVIDGVEVYPPKYNIEDIAIRIVKTLLDNYKFDVYLKNIYGENAIDIAEKHNYKEIAKLLKLYQ